MVEQTDENPAGMLAHALRLALAEKLQVDPIELEGIDTEAAAAALRHFVERDFRHEQLPEWMTEDGLEERRDALVAYGVRAALASELGVRTDQIERMSVAAAAHALDRIRSRRLAIEAAETPRARAAGAEDDAQLVGNMVHDILAEQLALPSGLVAEVRIDLAAHILGQVLDLKRRVAVEAGEQAGPQLPDRRDPVARVVRNAIAQDIQIHPRLLGSLDPAAAAVLLGRFAQARRTVEVLRSNIAIDELTEALRRSEGEVQLEREIRRVRRTAAGGLVVAFIDVDSLKSVNDEQGHTAGDHLLRELVAALRHRLRSYDLVVRWGGDEFLVILPQTDAAAADHVMRQVRDVFAEQTSQTFSFGLAELEDGDGVAELVARADQRLYEAKRARSEPAVETVEQLPAPDREAEAAPATASGAESQAEARPPETPGPGWRSLLRRLFS